MYLIDAATYMRTHEPQTLVSRESLMYGAAGLGSAGYPHR